MKIVCDSCGAKYSIADEKVRGKVFKIRCKKCSEVIVVRGDSGTDDSAAQRAVEAEQPAAGATYAAEAIWHLVVNGEQQGPYNPDQIGQMLSAGQIDWEAYAWRDGLEGWLHMREIEELVSAITGQPAAAPTPAPARAQTPAPAARSPVAELFGGGDGGAAGGFTAPEPAPAASAARVGGASGRARGGGGADLFAAAAEPSVFPSASAAGDDEDVVASKQDGDGAAATMTGARNENSVLFSLANLQALATKGQPAATSGFSGGAPTPAPPTRSGFASGSGSGLIDIRALSDGIPSTGAAPSSSGGGIDDLLSIGGPSAFAPTLGAPVLMPARSEGGKLLYVLLGVAALLVLGIIGLVVVILTRDDTAATTTASMVPPPVVQPATLAAPAPVPGALPAPVVPTNEQPAPTGEEAAGGDATGRRGIRGPAGPRPAGGAALPGPGPAPTKQSAAPEPTKRADSRTADLDDLIGGALGERRATKAPSVGGGPAPAPAAPRGNLPTQPARGDVAAAMAAVNGAVRGCAGGQTGTANIRIVFASSGRVTTSSVTSPPFAGTPAGSCMARAVKSARVPPFSNANLTVTFPFVVR
ncbi:MAG: zinc-ribbon domain-containing protein [Deltaproteobacteria bacterium]|nr:zinc-ribbon domain-containing protein [Deltaproteobacteria bacterium]